MAYDPLTESVALIESRRLEPVRRLSRRRRFAAMAVAVAGDVAATMFARRGVGCIWQETHVLARHDGRWELLGGGGATSDEDLLADRPAVLPGYLAIGRGGRHSGTHAIVVSGGGGARDGGDEPDRRPGTGRWVSYADLRVSAQVTSVQVADAWVPVPWHGHVLVVWADGQPPRVVAHDETGRALGEALCPEG